ncbi:MAG TPA: sigma 54-interacting transcriptional regulator, partial [Bacteroidota bacterium]|nr:sigma 54-interacting transcriptional regulator [Bacteroidota bacterium]
MTSVTNNPVLQGYLVYHAFFSMIPREAQMMQTDEAAVFLQRGPAPAPAGGSRAEEPVFISKSETIRELRSRISLVARSEASVLITGESGTGKEVIA